MTVPVPGTIPDSTLSPFQVRQKFAPQTLLRGLGYDICVDWDSNDNCVSTESIDDSTSTTTILTGGGYYGTPFDPSLFSGAGSSSGSPGSSDGTVTVTGNGVDGAGNVYVILSNGMTYTVAPSGSVAKTVSNFPTSTASGATTVTRQQSNAWAGVVTNLINAGVRLGTVNSLPPGTSLLPNGTIVGSGQSLIRPGVITSNSLTSGINALLQNPMFLIGGFGILAIALLAGGGRR